MTFAKSTTTVIALLLISLNSFGQASTEFDYGIHSFSESDVFKLLEDSAYLGLNCVQIISMGSKEVMEFSKKRGLSLTTVLIARTKAETDIIVIRKGLLEKEVEMIYDDIDRKLGITK